MSTTVTIRPNATTAVGSWTPSAGTSHACTSDDSDATFVNSPSPSASTSKLKLAFATSTLPAGAVVIGITVRVRSSRASGTSPLVVGLALNGVLGSETAFNPATTPSEQSMPTRTLTPSSSGSGEPWEQADIDAVEVWIRTGSTVIDVHEVYVDVEYNEAPTLTVAVTDPAEATTPTVTWTYDDPEGDAQAYYWVRIFDAATYGGGGFDPDTSTPIADMADKGVGDAFSWSWTDLSVDSAGGLINGTTYRAYVKVADSPGWITSLRWSDWAYDEFTVDFADPHAPIVTATADNANNRVELDLQSLDNLLTANQASLETATTGWVVDTNCTIARSVVWFEHGAASLEMTSVAGTDQIASTLTGTDGVPVVVGRTYTARATLTAQASARTCSVGIRWYTAAGAVVSTDTGTPGLNSTFTIGVEFTCSAVAPATAAFAAVIITVESTGAAEVHYVDQIALSHGTTTGWSPGGLTPVSFAIETSDDAGATWTSWADTAMIADANGECTVYDYRAQPSVERTYRAYAGALSGTDLLISPASATDTATVTVTEWWLKLISNAALNTTVKVTGPRLSNISEPAAIFRGLGRSRPVVLADAYDAFGPGEDGELTIRCYDDSAWDDVRALLVTQDVLLLQNPFGEHRWIRLVGDRSVQLTGTPTSPRRTVEVSYVEVNEPA